MSNTQINWQVGKKYRRRNGDISTMTGYFDNNFCVEAVTFNDGIPVWKCNGLRDDNQTNEYDIIEEVKEMKIEVGKYYKNRDGDKVYIVEAIISGNGRTHMGIIHWPYRELNSQRTIQYYHENGCVYLTETNKLDLIEEWKEPKSGVVYLNVYKDDTTDYAYMNRTMADDAAHDVVRLACVRVEWKEGQFDE